MPMSRRIFWRRYCAVSWLALAPACNAWAGDAAPAESLTVVLDDNYPPYVFRNPDGQVQGILPDLWRRWSDKTGVPVRLMAQDWAKARRQMESGGADVIDTIFRTPEREKLYDFSAPYATIDVSIYFHRSIGGVAGVDTLQGFTIGVKEGDACVDWLRARGVDSLRPYPSYEAMVDAAAAGAVRLLCIDEPPAEYFFHKKDLAGDFRHTRPLYSGRFHWAVAKGNESIRQQVLQGFSRISAEEREAIEERWRGSRMTGWIDPILSRYGVYGLVAALGGGLILMAWNLALRRRVAAHTAEIEYQAHHDALTGLPNRLLAKDRLEQAMAYAARSGSKTALILIDLDHFKAINDSLGHTVGDTLLRAVSTRLQESIRDTDTLGRLGGDEFLLVLNEVRDADAVAAVAAKILDRLARPVPVGGQELSVSLSMGIAVHPDDGADFDNLLRKADTAMFHAKEAGRNTYRFYAEQMNVDSLAHLQLRAGLRRALDQGEFVLHYQPQIDIASGALTGAEALIRWRHPERGLLAPGHFIALAEDSGLIVPIGEWVLREACRQAAAWQREGLPTLVMAVNLSAVQFKRGDLAQTVLAALADANLSPALLELELTESILIKDSDNVLATVKYLKSLGIKLSIDDFGTGYSSLAYLRRFAVDKLKIDQSFVRDLADDPEDAAIVRAIIQMALSLNLKTIAEGVESERLLDLLRRFQCDEAQGYHIARPMPADEFARYAARTAKSDLP